MDYRLPALCDEKALRSFLEEHFENGERNVIFCQDLLIKDYPAWVSRMQENAERGNGAWGRSLLLLCCDAADVVGVLCIRYEPAPELARQYGHIGYGVRPSERCKGYATQMLRHALGVCREKGLTSVTLGCHSDNLASVSVIRKCGGVLSYTVREPDAVTNCYYSIRL